VYILVAVMHTVSGLSLRDCGHLLFLLHFLINIILEDFCVTEGRGKYFARSIPLNPHTVISRLTLNPSYKIFVCYPRCSTCYPDNRQDSYPELCSSTHPLTQAICGRHLRKARTVHGCQYC
jgi:hypothetical protein